MITSESVARSPPGKRREAASTGTNSTPVRVPFGLSNYLSGHELPPHDTHIGTQTFAGDRATFGSAAPPYNGRVVSVGRVGFLVLACGLLAAACSSSPASPDAASGGGSGGVGASGTGGAAGRAGSGGDGGGAGTGAVAGGNGGSVGSAGDGGGGGGTAGLAGAGGGGTGGAAGGAAPVCGNRVVEGGEGCDDGNAQTGDGCSPRCRRIKDLAIG